MPRNEWTWWWCGRNNIIPLRPLAVGRALMPVVGGVGPLEQEGHPGWQCLGHQLGSVSKRAFLSFRKPTEILWNHYISWLALQEYRHQPRNWHTLQNKDKIRVHSRSQSGDYALTSNLHWTVSLYLLIWLLLCEIWVPDTKVLLPLASWGDLNNRVTALVLNNKIIKFIYTLTYLWIGSRCNKHFHPPDVYSFIVSQHVPKFWVQPLVAQRILNPVEQELP